MIVSDQLIITQQFNLYLVYISEKIRKAMTEPSNNFDATKHNFLEINNDGNFVFAKASPPFLNDIFLTSNNLRLGESIPTGINLLESMIDSKNTTPSAYEIVTKADEEKPQRLTTQSYLDSVQNSLGNTTPSAYEIVTDPKLSQLGENLGVFGVSNQTFPKIELTSNGQIMVNSLEADQIDSSNPFLTSSQLPKIDTEFDPLSNIHEELADHKKRIGILESQVEEKDEEIKKLQNQISKLKKQEKRNSRKTDDTRTDTHETAEHLSRKLNFLSADVDVLAALVDDD